MVEFLKDYRNLENGAKYSKTVCEELKMGMLGMCLWFLGSSFPRCNGM